MSLETTTSTIAPGPVMEPTTTTTTTAANEPVAAVAPVDPPRSGDLPAPTSGAIPAENELKDSRTDGGHAREAIRDLELPGPRLRASKMPALKTGGLADTEPGPTRPLQLLDLPVDVLKDIVKEVTHTNDLTSLALCHSALHRLAIPHIYSRFDIVWPDSSTHAEPRSGVDALTYGLATLVMAEEVFGEHRQEQRNRFGGNGRHPVSDMTIRRRRGNHYAQFTKKFSLGNGPVDWVQEYLCQKESGKMLNTLVALAVARMKSLETFIWDMPTGILRDVWIALSSLGDRGKDCRLEKLHVRFHNNSGVEVASAHAPHLAALAAPLLSGNGAPSLQHNLAALDRVEHPSFSILPPMASLSVMDIDELAYLDEMAVLIGNSIDKIKELRVGIARHATRKRWARSWDSSAQQVDRENPVAGSVTIGEKRLGGVLGILTGFVHDLQSALDESAEAKKSPSKSTTSTPSRAVSIPFPNTVSTQQDRVASSAAVSSGATNDKMNGPESSLSFPTMSPTATDTPIAAHFNKLSLSSHDLSSTTTTPVQQTHDTQSLEGVDIDDDAPPKLNHKLRLENLELERVSLSVHVLQLAFDWTTLTSLTLLNCPNLEHLWKALRRDFAPIPRHPLYPLSRRRMSNSPRKSARSTSTAPASTDNELDYPLKLKKVHTNMVSPALIFFLKETLAPNSLEELFLQDSGEYNADDEYSSTVTIDAIYRGPLRRHRGSLRKLLIDSSERTNEEGVVVNPATWRKWMFKRDILEFVCGGKMPVLRELGMAIEYRDWHFFLQHLPYMSHLRSLYIPCLADHVHGAAVDPRELALQFVDIVALRPEVELCYMGILDKCFEILENRPEDFRGDGLLGLGHHHNGPLGQAGSESGSDEEEEEDDEEEDEEEETQQVEEEDDDATTDEESEEVEGEDEADDEDEDEEDEEEEDISRSKMSSAAPRLRLREILFYDDKVAIFKARHGRL